MIADPAEYGAFLERLRVAGVAPTTIPAVPGTKRAACLWAHLRAGESVPSMADTRARLLLTGSRSGGLVVIDVDDLDDLERAERRIGPLPTATLAVRSPKGGLHLYLRAPPGVLLSSVKGISSLGARHIDVRAEGGVVMVPGSEHPTAGGIYRLESL